MRSELENPMVVGDYYGTCDACGAALTRGSWYHSFGTGNRRRLLCADCEEREEENNEGSYENAEGWHHPYQR